MAAVWHNDFRRNILLLIRSARESLFALAQSRALLATLCLFAIVDGVLLGLALATVYADSHGIPFPAWFYLNAEFCFAEIWEYCLTTAAAVALLWRYRSHREPIIGCLGVIFIWLTVDNLFAVHETVGHAISPLFSFAENAQPGPDDFGELAVFAMIGAFILVDLFLTALQSDRQVVIQSLAIIAMLACTAFFGVIFDFVDHAIPGQSLLITYVLSFIEDGSEMVLLSIAAAIAITARPPAAPE